MAREEGSLPDRSPQVRPVRVADLLSREGHPLRARALTESVRPDPRDLEPGPAPRRTFGMAAGAMLVLGTVVAGALGLNHGGPSPSPAAGGAEPVGALPGHGPTPAPVQPAPAAPEAAAPVQQPFVNAANAQNAKQEPTGPAGEIGIPARVRPPAPAPAPPQANPPAQRPQPAPAPAPQQPASGPVQTLTEPVTNTVGGNTLSGTVAPVTSTVDNTLQPALSLIGGLLGHK